MARDHIVGPHLIRIKIVNSNNACCGRFGVAQKISFLLSDDVLAYGVANPIDAKKSAYQPAPRGSFDPVLNLLGLDQVDLAGIIARLDRANPVSPGGGC
jgi:hypothetical protein